jgi:hypothetical protein
MAFMTVKLVPGVHAEQTPLLLQAGVVQSNLIRWRDGQPEKFGGWRKFYYTPEDTPTITTGPQPGPVRELWPWADFNSILYLAAGGDQGLYIVTVPLSNVTPQFNIANDALTNPTFTTTAGSSTVTVNNVDPNVVTNNVGSIVFDNYVSVGGLILYGAYPISIPPLTGDAVTIQAIDPRTGLPVLATTSVTNAPGVVSTFTVLIADSSICTVVLPGSTYDPTLRPQGFSVGQAVFFLPTTLTGSSNAPFPDVVVQESYTVLSVIDADTFTIGLSTTAANSVGPISENDGNIQVTTWIVASPPYPAGSFGAGIYGAGNYGGQGDTGTGGPVGTPVTAAGLDVATLDWCMVNFGATLIAQPEGLGFFKWASDSGYLMAQPIPQAPQAATGFFLAMPQQQLVAYGASTGSSPEQDPMLVRWCDNANYTVWVGTVDNQAGSYRLTRGSKIIGGIQAPMQAMLWTDIGFWLMTYIGYPDIWGFMEVAQECGLIAKKAVGVSGGQVFWMSRDRFWTFAGGQVQPLPCEVWDAVFQNLNLNLLDRIRFGANSGFDEVMWFYPSLATAQAGALQENDSYVKLNRVTGEWDYGTPVDVYGGGALGGLMISDWVDNNVFGHPISAMTEPSGATSQLMWQEMARDADTQPMHWWFRTGLFLLNEGEDYIFVDRCRPDFRWRKFADQTTNSAQISITLYAQDQGDINPSKPPTVYGPFTVTDSSQAFDPRARGRYFSFKVEGDDLGSFARLGAMKFRFSPDGRAG